MNTFTENDYKILKAIINKNDRTKGLTKINGTTLKEILDSTGLSRSKVRRTITAFIECNFIENGNSKVREKTYILTEDGFNELYNLTKNIFGEVIK